MVRAAVLIALAVASAAAHDIPADVTVRAFVKPEGKRLQLLVRVPLGAMRDVDFAEPARLAAQLPGAAQVWLADFIRIYEDEVLLPKPRVVAMQVSLPSDRSFASFDEALAHVQGPKPEPGVSMVWSQAFFDVLLEYASHSERGAFSIRPGLEHLAARVVTVLRFLPPGGAVRAYEFVGDPGVVPLDPRWQQASWRFVKLGFFHILDGTDHLLFLICLVIPFRRFRPLLGVITAFTVAHSITLIGSAFDLAPDALWFPPLIEMLIAASILYMALENIAGRSTLQRRWMLAFGFGLVHGFGFSFALRETLQFAGSHLLTSLVSFNAGVELGQLLVLAVLIPALSLCFRYVVAERMGTIILSALVAHTAWHWMTERYDKLRVFHLAWPGFNAAWMAGALRWAMWTVILAGLVWLLRRKSGPQANSRPRPEIGQPEIQGRDTIG
jgi:hypothetical protein